MKKAGFYLGGNAVNTALALKKLGIADVEVHCVAPWGARELSQLLSHSLNKNGIKYPFDDATRQKFGWVTPLSFIHLSEAGQPRFYCALHSIKDFGLEHLERCRDLLGRADWIHVTGLGLLPQFETQPTNANPHANPVADFFANVKKTNTKVRISGDVTFLLEPDSADSNEPIPWKSRVGSLLRQFDYLFPNEDEAVQMVGARYGTAQAAGLELLEKWMPHARAVCVTAGEEGVVVCEKPHNYNRVRGKPVTPVDATGAGDCWSAGFIAAMLTMPNCTHMAAAELANAVARDCVTTVGATEGIKPLSSVRARLANAPM